MNWKIFAVVMVILLIGWIALHVWAYATYGGKPVTEVPSWVHWIMLNR